MVAAAASSVVLLYGQLRHYQQRLAAAECTFRRTYILATASGLACFMISACAPDRGSYAPSPQHTPEPSTSYPQSIPSTKPSEQQLIAGDIGVVRPERTVLHRFPITNTSTCTWTWKRVHSECSCAVASMSAPYIRPGCTEVVDVRYTAGRRSAREIKRISVLFEEPSAPEVILELRATVRPLLAFSRECIELSGAYKQSDPISYSVLVESFSPNPLTSLHLRSSEPWLHAEGRLLTPDRANGESDALFAREVFRVDLSIDVTELPHGMYSAILEASDLQISRSAGAKLLIQLKVDAPIRSVPSRISLGVVTAGCTARRTMLLQFSPNLFPVAPPSAHARDGLKGKLSFQWTALPPNTWCIDAEFTASDDMAGVVDGHVDIISGEPPVVVAQLPVTGLVVRR